MDLDNMVKIGPVPVSLTDANGRDVSVPVVWDDHSTTDESLRKLRDLYAHNQTQADPVHWPDQSGRASDALTFVGGNDGHRLTIQVRVGLDGSLSGRGWIERL